MSKASQNANAVIYGIAQVCGLYGVEMLRMQSRVFTVTGAAGRDRPMFAGQWRDQFGHLHASGMADCLLRPRVPIVNLPGCPTGPSIARVTIPLWVEAKSGKGTLTDDQVAFKSYVETNGEAWLLIHDDLRPLTEWFERMGVRK